MRDIYDPPPPAVTLGPKSAPLSWSGRDLLSLAFLVGLSLVGAWWAWSFDATLGATVLIGGLFVAMESWFSALTFFHRHPDARESGRWRIFLAATAPWAMGLGLAAGLMVGLFAITDWIRF